MKKVFALVDCNNFFVSCERLFDPKLKNIPVVVLSNNDGCVVARSNEAKSIGIKMGEPVFKCKEIIEFFGVKALSSNFTLYKDISLRVMDTLSKFSEDIQIYSVDEAFLELTNLEISDYESFGKLIKDRVFKDVGIPVSVGIAPTKTLAKAASKKAKKGNGVFTIFNNPKEVLKSFPVEDVWGIGRAITKTLARFNVYTASDFLNLNPKWIRKEFSINLERLYWELLGVSILNLHSNLDIPKSMAYTRSFHQAITKKEELRKKIVHFATSLAENLRNEKLLSKTITVFISGNRFKQNTYSKNDYLSLYEYTNLRKDIVNGALKVFENIYMDNQEYKKAGVILTDIISEKQSINLFNEYNEKKILSEFGVDLVNNRWHKIVKFASDEFNKITFEMAKTPEYSTNWEELPLVF